MCPSASPVSVMRRTRAVPFSGPCSRSRARAHAHTRKRASGEDEATPHTRAPHLNKFLLDQLHQQLSAIALVQAVLGLLFLHRSEQRLQLCEVIHGGLVFSFQS